MPFCTNCGKSVSEQAAYCAYCGTPQPGRGAPFTGGSQTTDFLDGITDRTAAILCYIPVFGVIPAIIFLASTRFRNNLRVRFDGFQSLYLFVAWLIVSSAMPVLPLGDIPGFGVILKLAVFACWVYLLIEAAHQKQVRLPIIGDLAARSTTEQV